MEDVRTAVINMLPKIIEHKVTGEATILQLFDINVKAKQTKKVAGCRSRNGVIPRNQHIRVVRNGTAVFEGRCFFSVLSLIASYLIVDSGSVDTFRHHKTDITEVNREMDFGVSLHHYHDLQVGDILQSILRIELPGKL